MRNMILFHHHIPQNAQDSRKQPSTHQKAPGHEIQH